MDPLESLLDRWNERVVALVADAETARRAPEAWDSLYQLANALFGAGGGDAVERAAERLERAGLGEFAEFLSGLLDRRAGDPERAATRFAGLVARRLPSRWPAVLQRECALRAGSADAGVGFEPLVREVLADAEACGPLLCEHLAELALRLDEPELARLLDGARRRVLGGATAAAISAERLYARRHVRGAGLQAARALLAWPPPAPALRVLGRLCRERSYLPQAMSLERLAARTEGGRRDLERLAVADRLAEERRLRLQEVPDPNFAVEGEAAHLPLVELPGVITAATFYLEDDPELRPALERVWRRALRRYPGQGEIALRLSAAWQSRQRLRPARRILQLALQDPRLDDEEREALRERLQLLGAPAVAPEPAAEGDEIEAPPAGPRVVTATVPDELREIGRVLSEDGPRLLPVDGPAGPVDHVLQLLAEPARRSVLLTGESGVGKSALAHEVVRRIRSGRCPESLREFAVVEVTIQDLLVGTEYVGSLQTKMGKVLRAARTENRILLVVPDIAFAVGAGSYDKSDYDVAASLFTAIGRGDLLVLGEARGEEIRVASSRRPDFLRWFEQVELREPEPEVVRSVLAAAAERFANETGVRATPEAQARLVDLQSRFVPARRFPGKAVDFLEQLVRAAAIEGGAEDAEEAHGALRLVESERVVEEFARRTGLPRSIFSDTEALDLALTEAFFSERVLGQPDAVAAVLDRIAMIKAGLARPGRPLGSFFFVGPTGIGKTELARALAAFLFGSEERLVRLDMSEFSSADALWRLTGSPGGRHDPGTRGLLTEPVRQQPFCVILLDEIEKAAPQVFDLLLQVLDAGRLTDARGITTSFRNALVIMTSNLGAKSAAEESLGFGGGPKGESEILKAMELHFRPEFLNRIDRVVTFRSLAKEDLRKLAYREVGRLVEREGVLRRRLTVEIEPAVADTVLERGISTRYGARHLQRAVERMVAVPLARALVHEGNLTDASLRVRTADGAIAIEVVRLEPPAAALRPAPRLRERADVRTVEPAVAQRRLAEAAARLESLRAVLLTDEVERRREELEGEMATPSFWDQPAVAAEVQHEYARLVRRADRVRRLEDRLESLGERLRAEPAAGGRARPDSAIEAVGAELDRLEIESLLDRPEDVGDAFVLVASATRRREADDWVRVLVEMYQRWAQASRLGFEALGEVPPSGSTGGGVLLHVTGAYAFGHLSAEAGLHRRFEPGPETGPSRRSSTARVEVFLDRGLEGAQRQALRVEIEKLASRPGRVVPRLARRIAVGERGARARVELLAPRSPQHDDERLAFAVARLHGGSSEPPAEGLLVRQVREGKDARVRDPWTGIARDGVRSLLAGELQEFLLARLRKARG